jgi:hypothetical protein
MKFSEWAKEFDIKNPGKLRVMTLGELLSITEWDNQPERLNPETASVSTASILNAYYG